MRLYYFPFWRKQYLFHPEAVSQSGLTQMCYPYNKIAKLFWLAWEKFSFIKRCFKLSNAKSAKIFEELCQIIPELKDSIWVINTGDTGEEPDDQKTTGLLVRKGIAKDAAVKIFFKVGNNEKTKKSIEFETQIYQSLQHLPIVPKLLSAGSSSGVAYYSTAMVEGKKVKHLNISAEILQIINEVNLVSIATSATYSEAKGLKTVFSHGDFAPWNLIEDGNHRLKLVDWEFAGYYPLGYDLFSYIFQVAFLLKKHLSASEILMAHAEIISNFFLPKGVKNWMPYLADFSSICEKRYCGSYIGSRYSELQNSLTA